MPTFNGSKTLSKTFYFVSMSKSKSYLLLFFLFLIFLLGLLFGSPDISFSSGNTYYVAKNGHDSNPGTESKPWKTIQKAASSLNSGDTVLIKQGTYKERVVPQKSGGSGNYITYKAYPNHAVTIDGNGISWDSCEWGGLFHISGRSYITVSGIKVINSTCWAGFFVSDSNNVTLENNSTYNTKSSGILAYNSSGVIASGNDIQKAVNGGTQECISFSGVNGFEVKYNKVHSGVGKELGGEGIDIKQGSSNGKVYGNQVYDLPKEVGIYIDAYSKYTKNIGVFSNKVSTPVGIALSSEDGGVLDNVKVNNNIVYNCANDGIIVTSWIDNGPRKNIYIINNTVYKNGYAGGNGGINIQSSNVSNIVVRNNILSKNNTFGIKVSGGATVDHNLFDGSSVKGSNAVKADPKFVNASGLDFHLLKGSPAIDNGSSSLAPSTDFEGTRRPQGKGFDIGADEYGSGSSGTIYYPTTPQVSQNDKPEIPKGSDAGDKKAKKTKRKVLIVCPKKKKGCDFIGGKGIRNAVYAARKVKAGESIEILIRPGTYKRKKYTEFELPSGKIHKCFVNTDGKNLSFVGNGKVILNGKSGIRSSGFCVDDGKILIKNITIKGFKSDNSKCFNKKDPCSGGHGIVIANKGKVEGLGLKVDSNSGDGVKVSNSGVVDIRNSLFFSNMQNGIKARDKSLVTVINNTIYKNKKIGITLEYDKKKKATFRIINNIFAKNNKGVVANTSKGIEDNFFNNLFWENKQRCSNVGKVCSINGSINKQDPLFKNENKGDFSLLGNSPAKDAGKDSILDPDGSRSDIGMYGGPQVCDVYENLEICHSLEAGRLGYEDYIEVFASAIGEKIKSALSIIIIGIGIIAFITIWITLVFVIRNKKLIKERFKNFKLSSIFERKNKGDKE